MTYDSVQRAIADIRDGRMVILVDDEDRENEGDLCMAADLVTPEAINFMAKFGRGLICLTLTETRLQELQIPMMVSENTSMYGTAFTVSIEARRGVSTGISAADRATTIRAALDPKTRPEDLLRPGHIFPLRARNGGVLTRVGQTEGSVDLARMAGLSPAGVICEIMNDDGTMARVPDLERFAETHGLQVISIADLIEYRLAHESLVRRLASRELNHAHWGKICVHAYGTVLDHRQHLVLVKGDVTQGPPPLVRVHAGYPFNYLFGDLFGDDRNFMHTALQHMMREGRGVLVCLDRGEPEVTLEQRIQNVGQSPLGASSGVLREFGIGAQILRDLGLSSMRLLSANPRRVAGLEGYGLHIESVVGLDDSPTERLGVA